MLTVVVDQYQLKKLLMSGFIIEEEGRVLRGYWTRNPIAGGSNPLSSRHGRQLSIFFFFLGIVFVFTLIFYLMHIFVFEHRDTMRRKKSSIISH